MRGVAHVALLKIQTSLRADKALTTNSCVVIARSPDKNEAVRAIAGNRRGAGGVERRPYALRRESNPTKLDR
jgi:hypothetical protein